VCARRLSHAVGLLWDQAVHRYVERVFDAGILCPFQRAPEDAPERSE
jgi:hypothetical protein